MKLRLNFQLKIFISHVMLSEILLKETKKWQIREKYEEVTYKQHATKLFSDLKHFEESLWNDDM